MDNKLFRTDGIRGEANLYPMTADLALAVGVAAGHWCKSSNHHHLVVIGKDTRLSGYMFEAALQAGFVSVGVDVRLVGPMPTPALALLTRSFRADLGVMISASHNQFRDNGLKLFGADGYKLSEDIEAKIEALIHSKEAALSPSDKIGRAARIDDAGGRYIEFAKATFPRGMRMDGLKVIVDCANGAGYKVAPTVLWELGAEVIAIGVIPNGTNINYQCGSTAPAALQEAVLLHKAHIGIALDGDADRLIIVDETGEIIDGDQLIAVITQHFHAKNWLKGGGVVATIMSNLALEHYIQGLGLAMIRTKVGDRFVVEKMRDTGINVGGEQSGHIVLSDFTTTGDGLIAALQILAIIVESGKKASEVCKRFTPLPQILHNIRFDKTQGYPLNNQSVQAVITDANQRLIGKGRLLVRKSGTEPLIRIMAESEDHDLIFAIVTEIANALYEARGR